MWNPNRPDMRRLLIYILMLVSMTAGAAEKDSTAFVHRVGLDMRAAYLNQSHDFFRGKNALGRPMKTILSGHMQYSFMFPADSPLGRMYPTAYQGIGVASYSFLNHQEVGTPTAVYVFQGARIASFGPELSLDYEWNFGASFGWNPYAPADKDGNGGNPANLVIGTKVNAYVNASLMLSWSPVPEWTIAAGLDYTHFSNGDTYFPNAGIDGLGGRVGVVRSFNGIPASRRGNMRWNDFKGMKFVDRVSVDVIAYGAWNAENVQYGDKGYMLDGKFGVFGLHVNPLYRISSFLSVGPSLDIQYNEGVNLGAHVVGTDPDENEIRFFRPPLSEQLAAGLSLRAEIQMPIFSVNLGIGHNILYKCEELGGIYNFVALKAFVTKSLFAHVGFKASYTESSNNLMFGIGWRFGNNADD